MGAAALKRFGESLDSPRLGQEGELEEPKDHEIKEAIAEEKARGRRRGVLDALARKQNRENLRVLRQFLVRKDTRGFLEFLRRHGINDGTPEFDSLYKTWMNEISKL